MDQRSAKKPKRTSRQPPYLALLDDQMTRLRQIEYRLDDLLRQAVEDLDEEALASASERFDELVLAFPDLRLSTVDAHPREVSALLSHLDMVSGPLPGFEDAMARLYALCVTPQAIRGLRSKLYKVAGHVAETAPELLSLVAVAALSLDTLSSPRNAFIELVVCASAIESLIYAGLGNANTTSLDVSTWLLAEPSDALIAAVGEGQAYYYASIPGILPFLDQRCVLFDIEQLSPCACDSLLPQPRHCGPRIDALVTQEYRALLRTEIKHMRCALRDRYPASAIADVEMLAERALDALDKLPPKVNPLLQAIFVQSWVRYLCEVS